MFVEQPLALPGSAKNMSYFGVFVVVDIVFLTAVICNSVKNSIICLKLKALGF